MGSWAVRSRGSAALKLTRQLEILSIILGNSTNPLFLEILSFTAAWVIFPGIIDDISSCLGNISKEKILGIGQCFQMPGEYLQEFWTIFPQATGNVQQSKHLKREVGLRERVC